MEILSPAVITLIVLGIMAILFVTELIPISTTAMCGAITLGLLGVIPVSTVFSGLSNSTVILFAGMFVIGATMFHTGLAQEIGAYVVKIFGTSEKGLMLGTMLIAATLSSVSSNTGMTAALMPVIIGICAAAKIPRSRQLMPLAFAAGIGGTMTLVGSPPNIIANGALNMAGVQPFGFFEFAKIGIPVTIVGIIYMMFLGHRLLPKKDRGTTEPAPAAQPGNDTGGSERNPRKMLITGLTLLVVVVVMALDLKRIPLEMAAVMGAVFLILTGCIKQKDAHRGIDWVTIFLFAGMLPVAVALDKSGAGKMIADAVVDVMGGNPSPYVVTAILFLLSVTLTQFMSNTASSAILCPIGVSIASNIGVSPHGVVMAIAIAASCAFATPIGTPPNTIVLGAGGYRFLDYVKVGGPLVVIYFVLCTILIPLIWPFNQ